ncbi:unnamed protein product [Acanthoscelides obtectus]|uniref:Uncharacterized protein n=1 Tax=Acanthoscelides obtectus TaxID=200917 RepID=A0A9P0LKS0_ACAOB|nr:unnamed protein product [Acanthoscelides obtectus]CAK1635499.1 hypothetical protein AOBTE_LOCUS9316 [Acanthoscelides obtectus]
MASLWVGSDIDLPTLHQYRLADRLEFRLACLHNRKVSFGTQNEEEGHSQEDVIRRRRRSGTWPCKFCIIELKRSRESAE